MSIDNKLIGRRIKALRKSRKDTQLSLADKMGVSDQYISKLERGNGNIGLDALCKVADCYKIDVVELLGSCNTEAPQYLYDDIRELIAPASGKQRRMIVRLIKAALENDTDL